MQSHQPRRKNGTSGNGKHVVHVHVPVHHVHLFVVLVSIKMHADVCKHVSKKESDLVSPPLQHGIHSNVTRAESHIPK